MAALTVTSCLSVHVGAGVYMAVRARAGDGEGEDLKIFARLWRAQEKRRSDGGHGGSGGRKKSEKVTFFSRRQHGDEGPDVTKKIYCINR